MGGTPASYLGSKNVYRNRVFVGVVSPTAQMLEWGVYVKFGHDRSILHSF
jgi:hypothetical protein